MLAIKLALFGMTDRDIRLVNSVVPRYSFKNFSMKVVTDGLFDIALVNLESPTALEQLRLSSWKKLSDVHIIEVSLTGSDGVGQFQISQRSLVFQLIPLLGTIAKILLSEYQQTTPTTNTAALAASPHNAPQQQTSTPILQSIFSDADTVEHKSQSRLLRALVVDDSETVRIQLQGALKRIGIRCASVESGEQALSFLANNEDIDLVFLDVVMNGEDGYTICKKIRKNAQIRHLRVIMLTSRSSPFDRARGALAGCDTYLTKPIDSKSFYTAVDKSIMKICQNDRIFAASRGYLHAG